MPKRRATLIGFAIACLLAAIVTTPPGPVAEAGASAHAAAKKRCAKSKRRHGSRARRCAKPRRPRLDVPAGAPAPRVPPASPPVDPQQPVDGIARATAALTGRWYRTYAVGTVTGASAERTLQLCEGGRFLYVGTFVSTYVEGADPSSYDHPYGETRATGRWRVASDVLVPHERATSIVEYTTDDGETGRLEFVATGNGLTIDGAPAESGHPAVCT
jgi:hypothetical protein